jgi:SAM-dependent methyltransferase
LEPHPCEPIHRRGQLRPSGHAAGCVNPADVLALPGAADRPVCRIAGMRSFDDLVREAEAADVTGWGFGWLDGRATEERPPWGYARLLAARLASARAALDIDTGGGEVIAASPTLPARMCVTEAWPPNAARAREVLVPRGVEVYATHDGDGLPFPGESFDLVTSRHPVRPAWEEIHRMLVPGGLYFAQHVGPASAFELIELFLGPLSEHRHGRDPHREAEAAQTAGLTVTALRTARCRMEFFDIGAVVWILRKCVWWVPDFSVERYHQKLVDLDGRMRTEGALVAHSTRHLIEAKR